MRTRGETERTGLNHGSVQVIRIGNRLKCGAPDCPAIVGRLLWDPYGWAYPTLKNTVCPACGKLQAFNPDMLEADTLARYAAG
jgi:hypothetical protein